MGNKKKIFSENDFDKDKKIFSSDDFEKNKGKDKPPTSSNGAKKVVIGIAAIAVVCLLGYWVYSLLTPSNKDDVTTTEQVEDNNNTTNGGKTHDDNAAKAETDDVQGNDTANGNETTSPAQEETAPKTHSPQTEQNQDSPAQSAGLAKQQSKPAIKADRPSVLTDQPLNPSGSLEQKAKEVIRGKYGNGIERKQKLGDQYTEIQGKVNEMYKNGLVD